MAIKWFQKVVEQGNDSERVSIAQEMIDSIIKRQELERTLEELEENKKKNKRKWWFW